MQAPTIVFVVDGGEYSRSSGFPPAEGIELSIDHPLYGRTFFTVTKVQHTYTATGSHSDVSAAGRGDPFAVVPGPVYVHLERVVPG